MEDYEKLYKERTRMYNEVVEENGKLQDLQVKLNAALGALGYPTPCGTPEGLYSCGLCVSKEADFKNKSIEHQTLWKAFKMLAETR